MEVLVLSPSPHHVAFVPSFLSVGGVAPPDLQGLPGAQHPPRVLGSGTFSLPI